MNVMHLLTTAETGGIESLCRDYSRYSHNNNIFVVLWGQGGACATAINAEHGVAIELDSSKKKVLNVIIKLMRLVRQYSIDVVVVHHASPYTHIYMHLLKIRYSNIKTISYAHSVAKEMYRHNETKGLLVRKGILSCSLNRSNRVIAISNSVKKSLIEEFKIPSNRISVIYNGIDMSKFFNSNQNQNDNSDRLIYVGRLIEEKGVQVIIRALSKLSPGLDWSFDIVGDGEYRRVLEEQVFRLGLNNKVRFLGTRQDIPELLKQHDIFIHMPECEEGFGITIIEAMAAGLLCICKISGGIPEIIDNGYNGILLRTEDELTEILEDILTANKSISISVVRKNAKDKAKMFDISEFARELDCTINSL